MLQLILIKDSLDFVACQAFLKFYLLANVMIRPAKKIRAEVLA